MTGRPNRLFFLQFEHGVHVVRVRPNGISSIASVDLDDLSKGAIKRERAVVEGGDALSMLILFEASSHPLARYRP